MLNTILSGVGWLGTLLVFAAVVARLFRPQWDQYAYWAAIAGLALVVLYTLSQWRDIVRSFKRRQMRFSTSAVLSVIAVLGIIVLVNYLADRRNKRWDLTASSSFSLSDQTIKILSSLKTPVKISVFGRPGDFDRFRDRLAEFEYNSRNVSVEYVDADRQPARTRQYQITEYGTVIFEYDGRTERVVSDQEQELTNGLIKVTSGRQVKAYFTQGHGEKDPAGTERNGYSGIVEGLKQDNYATGNLVLAQSPEVPADASVVIVAGPTADFLPPEIDALRKYLRQGGKAFVMLDPPGGPNTRALPNLEGLLKEWGTQPGHDIVVDVSGVGQLLGTDASVPVAASYPSHAITAGFSLVTAYPLAQSVSPVTESPTIPMQPIIQTSDRSWAETDVATLASGGQVALDEAKGDKKGPITIALAGSMDAPEAPAAAAPAAGAAKEEAAKEEAPPKPQTRLVVVGDSDWATNNVLGIQGNRDLFVNITNWLSQQENLISIRPRNPEDRRITLTADQQRRINLMALVLIPGLILGSGVYTWWQRR